MKEIRQHLTFSRRNILKGLAYSLGGLLLASVKGGMQRIADDESWAELSEYDVQVPGLDLEFDGLTILHLSDIHQSEAINYDRLKALKKTISLLSFDLIAVTGDLTYRTSVVDDLVAFFKDLPQQTPVLMVMGNHDYWDGGVSTLQPIVDVGVRILRNEIFTLQREDAYFHVAGLDNIWEEKDELAKLLRELVVEGPAILMVHEPDVADRCAVSRRFFMQISGHSHGGQICLPGGFAPVLPWMGQKYYRGYYLVDGMMVYTSRGIGMSKPYIRMNCPPEISLYHFHPGTEPGFQQVSVVQGKI